MAAPAAGAAAAAIVGPPLSNTYARSPFNAAFADSMCPLMVIVDPSSEGTKVILSVSTPPCMFTVSRKTTDFPSQEHCIFASLIGPPRFTWLESGFSTSLPSTVQERSTFCVPRAVTLVYSCRNEFPFTVSVSFSLVGGGNCPKLLLEIFRVQLPFNFESCAIPGSAKAATATVNARNFRCMEILLKAIRRPRVNRITPLQNGPEAAGL